MLERVRVAGEANIDMNKGLGCTTNVANKIRIRIQNTGSYF